MREHTALSGRIAVSVYPRTCLRLRWSLPDGEVALIVTIDRPLSAADFASIGAVVGEIERLVAVLTRGDADA
jgi:hypothetical protein